jgi:steroid 5-alpha reductase family enzyme
VNLAQLTIATLAVGAALSAIMAAASYLQRRTGNSGWVDVIWPLGVGSGAFTASVLPFTNGGLHWRQIAVAVLAAGWCIRLGLHIAKRTRKATDDPRYRELIDQWGRNAARRMFWFLQSQAAVGSVLVISIMVAARNPDPYLRIQDLLGLATLAAAIIGEAIADRQLRAFRQDDGNKDRVCDVGLWRWSRHPNYFFEWLLWVAYPIIAIDFAGYNPYGWLALPAPVCMYWVLVHVSGIPPLEQHMLRSRGEVFRAYQQRTRPFLPLPLKR